MCIVRIGNLLFFFSLDTIAAAERVVCVFVWRKFRVRPDIGLVVLFACFIGRIQYIRPYKLQTLKYNGCIQLIQFQHVHLKTFYTHTHTHTYICVLCRNCRKKSHSFSQIAANYCNIFSGQAPYVPFCLPFLLFFVSPHKQWKSIIIKGKKIFFFTLNIVDFFLQSQNFHLSFFSYV